MIRISNLTLPIDGDMEQLKKKAAKALGASVGTFEKFIPVRQSIDARKKTDVHYVFSVEVSAKDEARLVERAGSNQITLQEVRPSYSFPEISRNSQLPPVIVGSGPAGLLAALSLARAGLPPILLERGQSLDQRVKDVSAFWQGGTLNPESNVQFGEGGAGTFSDGKLTTGTHDPRMSHVLQSFVEFGAPAEIVYQQKPHVGTDILRDVVKKIRQELLHLGTQIRFQHRLSDLRLQNGVLCAVQVDTPEGTYEMPCDALILAPGHSARDTFLMLRDSGVHMEQKAFAIGVRIEHRQADISQAQFGASWEKLPPADYKLACHLPNGRSAFTFCVCPGGQIVAAASQEGRLVTNGMSYHARDGALINGGFLVGVGPADFGGTDPLGGMRFQEIWEEKAYHFGQKGYLAPAQRVGDFLKGIKSSQTLNSSYTPGVVGGDLHETLPAFVTDTLHGALSVFDKKLHGFAAADACMVGVETRSSSPLRILRDASFQANIRGIYPCGEGAGYAGGIVSAAVDGIRVAEAVATAKM